MQYYIPQLELIRYLMIQSLFTVTPPTFIKKHRLQTNLTQKNAIYFSREQKKGNGKRKRCLETANKDISIRTK